MTVNDNEDPVDPLKGQLARASMTETLDLAIVQGFEPAVRAVPTLDLELGAENPIAIVETHG